MNFVTRIITSIVGGLFFFGAYFYSYLLFALLIVMLMLYVVFFEWPLLMGGFFSVRYFTSVLFYPIIPFLALLSLVLFFHHLSFWLPLYPFIIAHTHDTLAYCIGTWYGRHTLFPTISPHKTWEGSGAGFLGIILINLVILPQLQDFFLSDLWFVFALSCAECVLVTSGDLFISYLKRRVFIKDTGAVLPGHGGILDRFDSVLFLGVGVIVWVLVTQLYFPQIFIMV